MAESKALVNKNVGEQVIARINSLCESGFTMPKDFSYVNAIKQSKLKEIVNSRMNEDDEIFYATLESYYMSESGEEKASKSEVAVFAINMTDAKTKLDAYMKQGLDDMAIVKIAKTKFLDLIEI